MTYRARLTWKIFHRISGARQSFSADGKPILVERTGKSLLREVGGSVQAEYYPAVLEPIGAFFSKAAAAARGLQIAIQKTTFIAAPEALFQGPGVKEIGGSFNLHRYEDHLCVTIETAYFDIEDASRIKSAMALPSSAGSKLLAARLANIVAAALGGQVEGSEGKVFPCLELVAPATASDVPQSCLVELLTRHRSPAQNVVEEVFAKNRDHQVDGTVVLLDRQGLVCYAPPHAHDDERASCARRFSSCSALIELAAALQRLTHDNGASPLVAAARPLLADPKRSIPNSTSAARAWTLLLSEFGLASSVAASASIQPASPAVSGFSSKVPPPIHGLTILCIAAATIELTAVQEFLAKKFGAPEIVEVFHQSDYALRFRDEKTGATWYVVPLSFQGQVDAAVETKHLCGLVRPTLLLMVGMCMSMPAKGLLPGTVVIPNEVMVFDHERLTTEGVQHRPHGDRVDNGLFKFARLVAATTKFPYKVLADKGLASATSKVENPKAELLTFIEKSFPDAAAFDMEGWGFYRAGSGQLCLWIKAVADAGEPQGADTEAQTAKRTSQADVTRNAIDFAVGLVEGFLRLGRAASK